MTPIAILLKRTNKNGNLDGPPTSALNPARPLHAKGEGPERAARPARYETGRQPLEIAATPRTTRVRQLWARTDIVSGACTTRRFARGEAPMTGLITGLMTILLGFLLMFLT